MKQQLPLLAFLWLTLASMSFARAEDAPNANETIPGVNSPSAFYLTDDIQYFPSGPEFQLTGGVPGRAVTENPVLPPEIVDPATYVAAFDIFRVPLVHWEKVCRNQEIVRDKKVTVLSGETGKTLKGALQEHPDTQTVASPKLVVLEGREGTFRSGGEVTPSSKDGEPTTVGQQIKFRTIRGDDGKLRISGQIIDALPLTPPEEGESPAKVSELSFLTHAESGDCVVLHLNSRHNSEFATVALVNVEEVTPRLDVAVTNDPPPRRRNSRGLADSPFTAVPEKSPQPADPFAPAPADDDPFSPAPTETLPPKRQQPTSGGATLIPNHRPGDGGNPQLLDPFVAQQPQPAPQAVPPGAFTDDSVLSPLPSPVPSGGNVALPQYRLVPQPGHSNINTITGRAIELTDETKELSVAPRQSIIVSHKNRITAVDGFNDTILKVTPVSPNHLRLQGEQEGLTQLTISDEKGQSKTITISVQRDVSDIEQLIQRFWPSADVTVVPIDSAILLRGTAENEEDIQEIAEVVEVKATAVINQLRVGPSRDLNRALNQNIDLHLPNSTLRDAVQIVSSEVGVNVVLDSKSFEKAKRRMDEPVELVVSGISLRSVLKLLADAHDFTWNIEGDVIMIRAVPVGQTLDREMSALDELQIPTESTPDLDLPEPTSSSVIPPGYRVVTLPCNQENLDGVELGRYVDIDWKEIEWNDPSEPIGIGPVTNVRVFAFDDKTDQSGANPLHISILVTPEQAMQIRSALAADAQPWLTLSSNEEMEQHLLTDSEASNAKNGSGEESRSSLRADIRALHDDVRELIKLLKEQKSPPPAPKEEMTEVLPADGSPVVLYFRASWCGPCQVMEKTIREFPDSDIPLVVIDIDERPELAQRFHIDRIPTMIRVFEGMETARESGVVTRERLESLLSRRERTAELPSAAIIRITTDDGSPEIGSGFFVRDNLNHIRIVTAAHLLRNASEDGEIRVSVPGCHTLFSARTLKQDVDTDVAILDSVDGFDLEKLVRPVPWRNSPIEVGEKVSVLGYSVQDSGNLASAQLLSGQVKSIDRYEGPANFEIADMEAIQGMSGSMVLDSQGRLCGVVVAVDREDHCTVCHAASVIDRTVDPPSYAVTGLTEFEVLEKDSPLIEGKSFRGGLRIRHVKPHSPADKAGIRVGDILVGLDVHEIASLKSLNWSVRHSKRDVEGRLKFYVVRDGELVFGHLNLPPI
ncbi:MAG: trypsin-like peptidase domain-containing protein [Planctomycetaceae bacterium]